MIRGLRLHWCSLDASYRWLRTVVPGLVSPCCLPPCVRRGGVNISNLRPIWRSKQPQGKVSLFHVALINVRSLVKKNIYIKLLFALDALCMTETWIKPGDLSPFTELVPQGYSYLGYLAMLGLGDSV